MDRLEFETEDDDGFDNGDNITSGFVELSRLEKKEPPPPPSHADPHHEVLPVTVTTVTDNDDDCDPNSIPPPLDNNNSPRSMEASVRLGMTLLFALLVPAALLTVVCAPRQYALVIGAFWLVLILLFMGLVWVVRAVIMKDARAKVFHPYVHAVADRFLQEYNNFRDDWRQEILLLTDGPPPAEDDERQTTTAAAEACSTLPPPKRRKPKSAVFRAIVQPFSPFFRRRRRRKQKEGKEASSYAPPSAVLV
jgi:hypothetical protein